MNCFFTVKKEPLEIPSYRAWVVSIGCLLEGSECSGPIDANHFILKGQGGSDTECGGLCRHHHTGSRLSFHTLGHERFCHVHDIDWPKCRALLLEGYLLSLGEATKYLPTPDRAKRARGKAIRPLTKTVNKF